MFRGYRAWSYAVDGPVGHQFPDEISDMIDFGLLEATIRRDPGERGLASYRDKDGGLLCAGELEESALDLAKNRGSGWRVVLVTGFCILTDDGPAAETDGPPGTIYLTDRLTRAGYDVVVATDCYATPLLRAGFDAANMTPPTMLEFPIGADTAEAQDAAATFRQELIGSRRFSHRIAIERVGPSYDEHSIIDELRDEFSALVEPESRGVCHNMRGLSLDRYTAPLHLLFEETSFGFGSPPPNSIGIVDGGNEIGCGRIPWSVLRRAIKQGPAERTACRISTGSTIIAGVSNWGGYALGASVASLRGGAAAVETWTPDRMRTVIEAMVNEAGAVDGVTKRREATVDGLPLETELGMLDEIHAIVRGA
jgi:D-glutamate cyclase